MTSKLTKSQQEVRDIRQARGVTVERTFGGKKYVLKGRAPTKARARMVATKIRKMGDHRVRVTPIRDGYGIYLRTIGYRGR